MQKNNYLSGLNLSFFKTIQHLQKVETANVHFHINLRISHIAQRERICIFTEAYCVSLGFLWLDVNVHFNKIHFSFNVIFSTPKNAISNSVKVFFQLLIYFLFFFLNVMVPQVPQIPLVLEVPRFADLHFSNPLYDNQTCSNYYEDIRFTDYDPQTIMRTTRQF